MPILIAKHKCFFLTDSLEIDIYRDQNCRNKGLNNLVPAVQGNLKELGEEILLFKILNNLTYYSKLH